MNRIDQLFETKKGGILSVFITAGFPRLDDTVPLIREMEKAGIDMIEIGMPFSDPLADGPVIQLSNAQAIENGMSVRFLFEQIRNIREQVSIPLLLMGYLNPVLSFGMENFTDRCREAGIDGLILPDLPLREYELLYRTPFEKSGLYNIFLVTPETPEKRIRHIDRIGKGFIYLVSSSSTTGPDKKFSVHQESFFKRIRQMCLKNPLLAGFGISTHSDFELICRYAHGAIVGSAFIRALQQTPGNMSETVHHFISSIKHGNY